MKTPTRKIQLLFLLAFLLVSTHMRSGNNNRSGLPRHACQKNMVTTCPETREEEVKAEQALISEYRIGNLISII